MSSKLIFGSHTLHFKRVTKGHYQYTCPITGACWHVRAHVSKDFKRRKQSIVVTINGRVVWDGEFSFVIGPVMRYNEVPLFAGTSVGIDRGERLLKTMIKKGSA